MRAKLKPAPADPAGDAIIAQACDILAKRMRRAGEQLASPVTASTFVKLKLGGYPHEVFGVLFLDSQNRVIDWREMFLGTLTQTSVYPREVVKEAMALNCAGVILAHNHPSHVKEPSSADQSMTRQLQSALALIDVKVLDHFVVTADGCTSFAERGLL